MSEPTQNGPQEELPEGGFSNENVIHFVWRDDDPDATVEYWPNCKQYPRPPRVGPREETAEEELLSLMNAVDRYARRHGLETLLWRHVIDVLHELGYRKTEAPAAAEAVSTPDSAAP